MENTENQALSIAEQSSEPPLERELFDPKLTLGYFALESNGRLALASFETNHETLNLTQPDGSKRPMSVPNWNNLKEIETIRRTLTGYTGGAQDLLDRYLNGLVPLHILDSVNKHRTSDGKEISWSLWLRQYASPEEIMQIIYEHVTVVHAHATDERIQEGINTLQSKFVDGIDWLQSIDYIGSEPKQPSAVDIYYGDIFDTYLQERAGYYYMPESKIVLGQGHRSSKSNFVSEAVSELPMVLTHELVHGLLGKARYDTLSPLSERWIDEAMTELISRVWRGRNREDAIVDQLYLDERVLLLELIKPFEKAPFIIKMLSRAYSGSNDDRELAVDLFDKAYGAKDVLEKVTAAISWEEKNLAGGKPVDRAVEQAAVIAVTDTLKKSPESILFRVADKLIDDTKIAAQEPK